MRVAAFLKYGAQAASSRQRLIQYLPLLRQADISVHYESLLSDRYVQSLSTGEARPKSDIARAYLARVKQLLAKPDFDVLWIYAELFPYLPGQFEQLALRSGKPIVYDFDDAFFHQYDQHPSLLVRTLLGGKLKPLLRGAAVCVCANDYLRDYAAQYCQRTFFLPTVVNTEEYRPGQERSGHRVTLGWIGSPSTWSYVRPILPLLVDLAQKYDLEIRVVGAGTAGDADSFPQLEFVPWQLKTEVTEIQKMDIGIMPIPDLPWARGKSGYKLIQYMACGLPVLASPVGANREIVVEGETGLFASDSREWFAGLERLIADESLRKAMGAAGRARAERFYSIEAHAPRLVALLKSLADGGSVGGY